MKELRPSDLAYRVILMICSAFIFLSLPLLSTSVQGRSDLADPLIFLGNEQLAPIIYQERGITKGIVVDISRAISEKTGRPIEVHAMNWEEAQRQVLSGEADALLQINPNPDRKTNFDFSEEILASEFSLFIRNGNMHIRTMDDLTDRAVGVEPGGYPHILVQNDESIKIEIITDWTSGFQMVANGEIDAILVDRWIGEYQLAQSSSRDITVVNEPVEISSSRIAVRKGDWELLDMINSGLQSIKHDGTMNDILAAWQGQRVIYLTEDRLKSVVLYGFMGLLGVILLVLLFAVFKLRKLSRKLERDVELRTKELHETNQRLQQANVELETLSMVDPLTEIANRRYFNESLQDAWGICTREKLYLTLIMLDIDHFKHFNDTYGHLVGDDALKHVADVIRNYVRRSGDLVARYGGEEFIIMLMDATEDDAAQIAENIRHSVERTDIQTDGHTAHLTVSVGIAAVLPDPRQRSENLINAADQAMYLAKESGRNRVVRAGGYHSSMGLTGQP